MTGTGSGDGARESLALDEAGDAAPPEIRNGTQERLGAGPGVNLGAGEGTGSGAASRRALRESRRRLDAWEGVGDVKPGECRRDLWPDLRWLLRWCSRERDRERDRATDGAGVVSLPESPEMLDATAKSSKEDGDLCRWRCREDDRRWCLLSTRRGGSATALEGMASFDGLADD